MKGPSLVDGIPPWRREKRQPTRAELAAKHIADGGTESYALPMSPIKNPSTGEEIAEPAPIKVKRYNQ